MPYPGSTTWNQIVGDAMAENFDPAAEALGMQEPLSPEELQAVRQNMQDLMAERLRSRTHWPTGPAKPTPGTPEQQAQELEDFRQAEIQNVFNSRHSPIMRALLGGM